MRAIQELFNPGASGTPGLGLMGDNNTGIGGGAAGELIFYSAGVQIMKTAGGGVVINAGGNTINLPTTRGTNSYVLTSDGAGNATWAAVPGGTAYWNLPTWCVTGGSPYTATSSDIMMFDSSGTGTILLPAAPALGYRVFVSDYKGNAAAKNWTINGNGKNIDSAATYTISTNNFWGWLVYDGTVWRWVQNSAGGGGSSDAFNAMAAYAFTNCQF